MDAATAAAIEREKKLLPFGWGRFGKALDRLGELLMPGEVLELSAVGVYSQHQVYQFGFGITNVLVGVTDRRIFLIGTSIRGKPLEHFAPEWAELRDFIVLPDEKRAVLVGWGDRAMVVVGIAKSAFGDLSNVIREKGIQGL